MLLVHTGMYLRQRDECNGSGTTWLTRKDLKNYLQMREEAKERDHRKAW